MFCCPKEAQIQVRRKQLGPKSWLGNIEKAKLNALGDSELSNLPIPVPVVLKTFQSGRESGGELVEY